MIGVSTPKEENGTLFILQKKAFIPPTNIKENSFLIKADCE